MAELGHEASVVVGEGFTVRDEEDDSSNRSVESMSGDLPSWAEMVFRTGAGWRRDNRALI